MSSPRLVGALLCALVAGCAEEASSGLASVDAPSCGSCHADAYGDWQASSHARSSTSPVFTRMLPLVGAAWGAAAEAQCVSCHSPGFGGDVAIGCISCHGAVGNRGERDGLLVVDETGPIARRAGTERPDAPHALRESGLLTSASLCGTCHEVTGPNLFFEPALTDFRASPASTLAHRECVDCHVPRSIETEHDHRFVGIDPPWDASAEDRAAAQAASEALVRAALDLQVTYDDARGVAVVDVRNTCDAHSVPSGIAFLRDFWVDANITRASGPSEMRSRVLVVGPHLMRGDAEVALITDADRVESGSIAPGEHRTADLAVARGDHVELTLFARAIRADTLHALALDAEAAQVPTLRVASATLVVPP